MQQGALVKPRPDELMVETHPCAHARVPVGRDICTQLCSVVSKNHGGCTVSKCASPWRICSKCVFEPLAARSKGPVDPISGLCEMHGGTIVVFEEAVMDLIEIDSKILLIPIDQIAPMLNQPRKKFDPLELQQLADSIKHKGQLQPGLVVKTPGGKKAYELRDGERRLRACKLAGVPYYRATVQTSKDSSVLESLMTSAAMNFNRSDHTPYEEIDLVRRLLSPCPETGKQFTGKQVAESLGKAMPWVSSRKIAAERLTEGSLELISENPRIPFAVIKEVADFPPDNQLKGLYDYINGKVRAVSLRQEASRHRQAEGRVRSRKPSDIWIANRHVIATIASKVDGLDGVLSTEALSGVLRDLAWDQGEGVAESLEKIAAQLHAQAGRLRAVKATSKTR